MKHNPDMRLQINSISIAPDLKRFATTGVDFCIRVWDFQKLCDPEYSFDENDSRMLLSSMHNESAVQVRD